MELAAGTFLQGRNYLIERVLGRGTYGITYLATDFSGGGAKVAVKEFFMNDFNSRCGNSVVSGSDKATFEHYKNRFRRESQNLRKLSHPNIVKVADEFEENGTAYYVMEYIDGGNLNDWLEACGGRLGEEEVIGIASKIADALQALHSSHMLHLDLKPGNVMRTSQGEIKLIDFGLTKQYLDNGMPETSTHIGKGTPGYAAPEQAGCRQDCAFSVTMDIYSFGATLFKLLTGKTPPDAYVVLEEGFPRRELLDLGVSDEMTDLIEHAMSPKRLNRPQSVDDLIDSLPGGNAIVASIVDDDNNIEDDPALRFMPKPARDADDDDCICGVVVDACADGSVPSFAAAFMSALKRMFCFRGTASRLEFAAAVVIGLAFGLFGLLLRPAVDEIFFASFASRVYTALFLAFMFTFPVVAAAVRRSRGALATAWPGVCVCAAVVYAAAAVAHIALGGFYAWSASSYVPWIILSVTAVAVVGLLPDGTRRR